MKEALDKGNVQEVITLLEGNLGLATTKVVTGTGSKAVGVINALSNKFTKSDAVEGNELPLDYILRKIQEDQLSADKIISYLKIVDLLVEKRAELLDENKQKLNEKIAARDDAKTGELVIRAMQNGYPELAPVLIAAGAAQEMEIGELDNTSSKFKNKNKTPNDIEQKVFSNLGEVYNRKTVESDKESVTISKVASVSNWTLLAELAVQMAIARSNGKDTSTHVAIAKNLVANGAEVKEFTKHLYDSKGQYYSRNGNMLDILKDNIDFQETPEKKKEAKQDFDQIKDALREGQAMLKAQIIADRAERGGYKALLDDAVHMFKKAVGVGVEETTRDKLREKQKAIGKALRESGSLSSSVANVLTGNFGSKRDKGRTV